jgi:hypothetical protein
MKGPNTAVYARLLPVLAVAGVLALSYIAQPTVLGASSSVGYGNNCGVKGSGYHDHGKLCPNRPFPGHGKGLAIAITKPGGTGGAPETRGGSTTTDNDVTVTTENESTVSTTTLTGKAHGKAHSHGRGRSPN